MPNINTMKKSNFLKKEDVDPPVLVTIATVDEQNVAKEGAPEEMKWCLHLDELDKPVVLNFTNMQIIARITGSEETEEWSGQQIVLYNDPNVSFGGKIIGGIRVRAPRKNTTPGSTTAKPKPAVPFEEEDGLEPF